MRWKAILFGCAMAAWGGTSVWGQACTPPSELTALDGAADDRFGSALALSGNTLVVGAPDDQMGGNVSQGSAYVFVRAGNSWTQQAHLVAPDGQAQDQFGAAVGIDGDTIVVGAYSASAPNVGQGAAYVFVRSGTAWTQTAKLTASDGTTEDLFGSAVAVRADLIAVGAPNDRVGTNQAQGSAYVFMRASSGVAWDERTKLIAPAGAAGDAFGTAVAVSGRTVLIGATESSGGGNRPGAAYVFEGSLDAIVWTYKAKLVSGNPQPIQRFGAAVSLDNGTAVVGAWALTNQVTSAEGAAYVFSRTPSGTAWLPEALLVAGDGAPSDAFGYSVAISGDTAVIGANGDWIDGHPFQGSAYVFVRSQGAAWANQAKLVAAADGQNTFEFGSSVALDGDTAVAGAPARNFVNSPDQGSAWVFRRTGVLWTGVGDFNKDGHITLQDLFAFLSAWFAGNMAADVNHSDRLTAQDVFDFLASWFGGC